MKTVGYFSLFLLSFPVTGMNFVDYGLVNAIIAKGFSETLPDSYKHVFTKPLFFSLSRIPFQALGIPKQYSVQMSVVLAFSMINNEFRTISEITGNVLKGEICSDKNKLLLKKLLVETLSTGTVLTTNFVLYLMTGSNGISL